MQKFNVFFLLGMTLWAQEPLSDTLLTPQQQQNFTLQEEQSTLSAGILRDSWIQPIQLNYSGSYSNKFDQDQESYSAAVRIDQPIFKSGGIYFGIKYAQANAYFNALGIKSEKNTLIKQAMQGILNLRIFDLQIKQAKLSLDSAMQTLQLITQQYDAGELGIDELNDAILNKNSAYNALLDLQTSKANALYEFQTISEVDYETLPLPKLTLINKDEFLRLNIDIQSKRIDIQQKNYNAFVTLSNYLPTLSINAGYNYTNSLNQAITPTATFSNENQYLSYGFSLSMPLDFNSPKEVQKAHVEKLLAHTQLTITQENSARFYKKTHANIKRIDKQKTLALEDAKLLASIKDKAHETYQSGQSNITAYIKAKNNHLSKTLDVKIFTLKRQIELLNLYEKLYKAQS